MTARTDAPKNGDGGLDPRTRAAVAGVAVFGAMFALGAAIGWSTRAAISVAVGAGVAVANLYGLARILGGMLRARDAADGSAGMWGIFALAKVFFLFGGVWLLLTKGLVDPIPLVLGWMALPVGVAAASIFSDKTDRTGGSHGKEAPPENPDPPDR